MSIMKKLTYIYVLVLALLMASCVENTQKYQQLQTQYDSLVTVNETADTELGNAMKTLGEIEAAMAQVREAENMLLMQDLESDSNTTVAEIRALQALIDQNKQKISDLESRLSKESKSNATLKAAMNRLKEELEEKDNNVISLKEELAARNIIIDELNEQVAGLTENIDSLTNVSTQQSEIILSQQTELNTVWYCVGSIRELKDRGLMSGKDILPNGSVSQYLTSADKLTFEYLPLASKKASILTNHPDGSYQLVKGEDKSLTLRVLDKEAFWSVSRYLIISIK
mgnify:CR=1 FL=1